MATYTIVNGGATQAVNVNGGGTDVDAYTYKDAVTLTTAELAVLLDGATYGKAIAVFHDLNAVTEAQQIKRVAAIAAMYLST